MFFFLDHIGFIPPTVNEKNCLEYFAKKCSPRGSISLLFGHLPSYNWTANNLEVFTCRTGLMNPLKVWAEERHLICKNNSVTSKCKPHASLTYSLVSKIHQVRKRCNYSRPHLIWICFFVNWFLRHAVFPSLQIVSHCGERKHFQSPFRIVWGLEKSIGIVLRWLYSEWWCVGAVYLSPPVLMQKGFAFLWSTWFYAFSFLVEKRILLHNNFFFRTWRKL